MDSTSSAWSDDELLALYARVSNAGRWGAADELGTLNYISPQTSRDAARLAKTGTVISLARPITPRSVPSQPAEVDHRMFPGEMSADDYLGLPVHQQGLTHLDCVSHVAGPDGKVYNERQLHDVITSAGLTHGSIYAQRGGIVSRGVLLDIPAGLGLHWLEPGQEVSAHDLEAAERYGDLHVRTGDVAVVRGGVVAREAELGPNVFAPGLGPDGVEWLHDREVAVYAGDMPDRVTPLAAQILGLVAPADDESTDDDGHALQPTRFPLPLHQIGIAAMGLVLLDFCLVEQLARTCRELRRYEFLFVAAPLPVQGGTGSPVNPLAIF